MKIMDFYPANCKNCYKCVRNCSVKAIRIVNDQAEIIEEKCIACGKCFLVCPQNARNIHSDLNSVKNALSKKKVIVSVAPSYKGIYEYPEKLIGALYELGIHEVEETAIGAQIVTDLYNQYIMNNSEKNIITSCCPSANLLIRKFYPKIRNNLIPIDSPMILHSKMLKEKYGEDSFIVFLGPCISKKCEAYGYQKEGIIDAVISFEELEYWLNEMNICIEDCEEKMMKVHAGKTGSKYPLDGGIMSGIKETALNHGLTPLSVNGVENCMELFESLGEKEIENICAEVNLCQNGCINGPAIPKKSGSIFKRKTRANERIYKNTLIKNENETYNNVNKFMPSDRIFNEKKYEFPVYEEEKLKEILDKMGKYCREDELNCGACGYDTCREKAKAVYEGISHTEMCIPNMRIKAERLSNVIFEVSPNILILLDYDLNIMDINPQGEKAFNVTLNKIKGQNIDILMMSEDFERVIASGENIVGKKIKIANYSLKLKEYIINLDKQKMVFGMFSDVTEEENRNEKLADLKYSTIETVSTVIDKQMRVVQEIAGLLGETTAETKIALLNLKKVVEGEEGEIK